MSGTAPQPDPVGLSLPGAHAVLIGTGGHVPGSDLPGLPAVDATLDDLQRILRDICGMAAERVHRVPADAAPSDVVAAVERVVADATGAVLVYYVGHGLLGPQDELYLATYASRSAEQVSQAVPYRTLKDLLGDSAGGSIVVLDCCFSGRATVPGDGRPPEPYASARPSGSVLLSSASHFALSFAPDGERHTRFSGRLLRLLEVGDPSGPLWLTVDRLYAVLDREFRNGPIRPRRQSEGTLGALVIARNRAYRPESARQTVPPADVPCPYPGMKSFGAEESEHFFGRAELTARLLDAVCAPEGGHPVILVGASGVGKSSLLRAGLLAGLERRHEAEAGQGAIPWPALLLPAPGPRPLRALAGLWARATGREEDEVRDALDDGRLPEPLPGRRGCRVLVVDQFEETFTRCQDPEERARFIEVLTGDGAGPRIVLGLRADHYGSCLSHPALVRALEHGQLTIPPMNDDALRAVIERPAEAAGLSLEDGLTDRLLHDLWHGAPASGPDAALPFLAHALRETWLRRSGALLTLAGYQATGGIWHSVTTTTEELYQSLDEPARQALRELLLRMVHLTVDGTEAVVRRRVRSASLLDGLSPHQRRLTAGIRDRLAEARLITMDRSGTQISHEALLRAWPRLRRWIDEDRAGLVLRQQLAEVADAWRAAERDPAYLYRGTRLEAAVALARKERLRKRRLRRLDWEFLTASTSAARAEQTLKERQTRRLKGSLAGVAVALCLVLVAALAAFQQSRTAGDQRRLATYRALVAEAGNLRGTHPQTALDLSLAAYRLRPTTESRAALLGTLLATSAFAGSSAIPGDTLESRLSDDGRVLAAVDLHHRVVLWDVSAATRPARLATLASCANFVDGVAFSRDGRTLATACRDGSLTLWGLADRGRPQRRAVFRAGDLPGTPDGVAFSPDGTTLAAVGWWNEKANDGAMALWDIRDQAHPRRLADRDHVFDDSTVAFGPDGRTLVTAADRITTSSDTPDKDAILRHPGATLWDVSDPGHPRRLRRLESVGEEFAFSPDGRLLVTGDGNGVVVWDVSAPADPERLAAWTAHKEGVTAVAFSPDGRTLATGSFDDTVALWDLKSPAHPRKTKTLTGHDTTVNALAFSPDARVLASAADDAVFKWNTTSRGRPEIAATVSRHGRALDAVALSPDGKTLATGGFDETVEVWDFTHPDRPTKRATLTGHSKPVSDIAISPDGRTLASCDMGGTILLWDVTDPSHPRRVASLAGSTRVFTLAFAPDGTSLVAAGAETLFSSGWAALWDVRDVARPRALTTFSGVDPASGIAFSPDNRLLAMQSGQATVLWDRAKLSKIATVPGTADGLAFGPDGRTLATRGPDEALLLWDLTDPAHPRQVGRAGGFEGYQASLAFHPEGNLLAAPGQGGDLTVWDIGERTQPHVVTTLTGHADDVSDLTFSPDGRWLVTAGNDGAAIVWDLSDLPAISADTVGAACRIAGDGLTREEWKRYAPGLPYQRSCPGR